MAILNEYLNQYKGQTINDRIVKDCSKYLLENKKKSFSVASLVQVLDPKTKEILGLGGSDPNDLFLDFIGEFWEAFMRPPQQAGLLQKTLTDISGTPRLIDIQSTTNPYDVGTAGTQIQIGSGSTAPVRTDFGIENPFIVSPESGLRPTGNGFYSSALGQISASAFYVAGGSGTIRETIETWFIEGFNFAFARDSITPNVSFVPDPPAT